MLETKRSRWSYSMVLLNDITEFKLVYWIFAHLDDSWQLHLILPTYLKEKFKWFLTKNISFTRRMLVLESLLFIITNLLDVQTSVWQTWLETKWKRQCSTSKIRGYEISWQEKVALSLNIYSISKHINLGKQKPKRKKTTLKAFVLPIVLVIPRELTVWPWSISTSFNPTNFSWLSHGHSRSIWPPSQRPGGGSGRPTAKKTGHTTPPGGAKSQTPDLQGEGNVRRGNQGILRTKTKGGVLHQRGRVYQKRRKG